MKKIKFNNIDKKLDINWINVLKFVFLESNDLNLNNKQKITALKNLDIIKGIIKNNKKKGN